MENWDLIITLFWWTLRMCTRMYGYIAIETMNMISPELKSQEIPICIRWGASSCCWLFPPPTQPDRPFHNFRVSTSGDRRNLCTSGTSCDGFWSFKIIKRSVRYCPLYVERTFICLPYWVSDSTLYAKVNWILILLLFLHKNIYCKCNTFPPKKLDPRLPICRDLYWKYVRSLKKC